MLLTKKTGGFNMTGNNAAKDFIKKIKNGEFDNVEQNINNDELDFTDEYVENLNKEYKDSLSSTLNEILK